MITVNHSRCISKPCTDIRGLLGVYAPHRLCDNLIFPLCTETSSGTEALLGAYSKLSGGHCSMCAYKRRRWEGEERGPSMVDQKIESVLPVVVPRPPLSPFCGYPCCCRVTRREGLQRPPTQPLSPLLLLLLLQKLVTGPQTIVKPNESSISHPLLFLLLFFLTATSFPRGIPHFSSSSLEDRGRACVDMARTQQHTSSLFC